MQCVEIGYSDMRMLYLSLNLPFSWSFRWLTPPWVSLSRGRGNRGRVPACMLGICWVSLSWTLVYLAVDAHVAWTEESAEECRKERCASPHAFPAFLHASYKVLQPVRLVRTTLFLDMFTLAVLAIAALPAILARNISDFSRPIDVDANFHSFAKRVSSGCGTSAQVSCSTSSPSDTCCVESPGGLLLQTQFWDTNPSTGPSNSWTIHGLWPDNCDGTFQENCDSSRAYTGIASLLTAQGASDTLSFMQQFWVDINGKNEQFWEHEWSTHGTCMSTLEPSCLPSGSAKGAEAVIFFENVVKLFKTLPTYDWLAAAGITPSSSKTYTLAQITSALKSASGVTPALSCSGTSINQISYYMHLRGSVIDGAFQLIDSPKSSSCASTGLKYPLKSGSPTTTGTTSAGGSSPTGAPGTLPSKALIHAVTSSGSVGGLLSGGTWSTQTPGTYTISGSASSFTMSSSKGSCGVSSGKLSCGSGVSTTFSAVTSGSDLLLASGGSTAFSSDATPSGSTQQTVFTGSSHSETFTLSIVST
ncbi:ribonuclease T2-like protein [Amylostereum chailletii]|nr:ribonuclease T2-like protein [Amylostereum chailletii]